jgi:hypothetical protein
MGEPPTFYYETEIEWCSEKAGILHGPNLSRLLCLTPCRKFCV